MKQKKICVIVPVYNCESWIDDCLRSITTQTYQDIIIVLVNDGSKDHSLDKCKEWASIDTRIVVIDKPNGGVSTARNAGIDKAIQLQTDYIAFVDADDWIAPNMYEEMLALIDRENADLCICGRTRECKGKSITYPDKGYQVFLNGRLDMRNLSNQYDINISYNKLYPIKLFAEGLRFPIDIQFGEDLVFEVEVLKRTDIIAYVSIGYYHYRDNQDSVSYNMSRTKLQDAIIANTKLYHYMKEKKCNLTIPFDFAFGAYVRAYNSGGVKCKFYLEYLKFFFKEILVCSKHLKCWIFLLCPYLYNKLKK